MGAPDFYTESENGITHATSAGGAEIRLFFLNESGPSYSPDKFRPDPPEMRMIFATVLCDGLIAWKRAYETYMPDILSDFVQNRATTVSRGRYDTTDGELTRDLAKWDGAFSRRPLSTYAPPVAVSESGEMADDKCQFGAEFPRARAGEMYAALNKDQEFISDKMYMAQRRWAGFFLSTQPLGSGSRTF